MKPLFTLREALDDPHLLGGLLEGSSWRYWKALLIAAMGEELSTEERVLFREITAREVEPGERVDELWGIIGRRGGKTRAMACLAAYIAACCDWRGLIVPGEKGILALFAATERQARVALGYISAIFADEARPLFHSMRMNETQEMVELDNDGVPIAIEVRPASFKTSRGISAIGIICDEIAFWSSGENAANPDTEILNALKPSLGTTGGMLFAISNPYARRGELWTTYRDEFGPAGDPRILVANAPTRTMNETYSQAIVDRALKKDKSAASAEYLAEFRSDVEGFVSLDVVDEAVTAGLEVRSPRVLDHIYVGFLDAAGGSGTDSITMAVAHYERGEPVEDGEPMQGRVVLDLVVEEPPPFSPDEVAAKFAALLRPYRIGTVTADKWGAEWVASPFRRHGITVEATAEPKSSIYLKLVPLLNSRCVSLLDNARLRSQLVALERKAGTSGRDIIDHPRGGHDDLINAAAGALVLASAEMDGGFDWGGEAYLAGLARFAQDAGLYA